MRNVVGSLVVPFFQVRVLILQRVGQLVRHHRLLLVGIDPVQHVHGLGLRVVISLDLLLQQRQQKRLELKVAVEQAKFLQHDLIALQSLGALVLVEFFVEIALHCGARGEGALHGALDRQAGLLRGELDELVDQREELLGLLGRDVRAGLTCVSGLLRRGGLCRAGGRRSRCGFGGLGRRSRLLRKRCRRD